MKSYAKTSWTAGDIQSLRPNMNQTEAEEFLKSNENHLRDRLVELGWEVIESLLTYEGK